MKGGSALSSAIDAFKAANAIEAGLADEDDLGKLGRDDGLRNEWEKLKRHKIIEPQMLLGLILECSRLAPLNREAPALKSADTAHYKALEHAASILAAHYEKIPIIKLNDGSHPAAAAHNAGVAASQSALAWIKNNLASGSRGVSRAYRIFPSSQKRQSEQAAFQKLLSARLETFFHQPLDGLVAAVSSALYPRNEPVSLDAVRRARTRETNKPRV